MLWHESFCLDCCVLLLLPRFYGALLGSVCVLYLLPLCWVLAILNSTLFLGNTQFYQGKRPVGEKPSDAMDPAPVLFQSLCVSLVSCVGLCCGTWTPQSAMMSWEWCSAARIRWWGSNVRQDIPLMCILPWVFFAALLSTGKAGPGDAACV